MMRRLDAAIALAGFFACIPAANWMIGHVGECVPNGPCLIPVAPGLMAPSGVLMIGAALVFRDAVHEAYGWRIAMAAIVAGAALSWLIAPQIAMASGVAFLLAETADLLVYAPLRRRVLTWAVLLSGFVGAVVDSAVFLFLAFGSLDFLTGQVVGKMWMSIAAIPLIHGWRRCFGFHKYGPDVGGIYQVRHYCVRCGRPWGGNGIAVGPS